MSRLPLRMLSLLTLALGLAAVPVAAGGIVLSRSSASDAPLRPAPVMTAVELETPVPSLSGLGEQLTPEQLHTMAAPPPGDWRQALAPVVGFLHLGEEQIAALVQLLRQRQEAAAPLVHEIIERERVLAALLRTDAPDPATVGRLILEIRQLHGAVAAVQARFLTAFELLLTPEQQERHAGVRLAARLQPLLPAFVRLGLL